MVAATAVQVLNLYIGLLALLLPTSCHPCPGEPAAQPLPLQPTMSWIYKSWIDQTDTLPCPWESSGPQACGQARRCRSQAACRWSCRRGRGTCAGWEGRASPQASASAPGAGRRQASWRSKAPEAWVTIFLKTVIHSCCESETWFTQKAQKGHLALDEHCLLRRRSSSWCHHLSRHHLGKEEV